jgi:peptidoglycan/LPS O-acetylase OafA/YrhL
MTTMTPGTSTSQPATTTRRATYGAQMSLVLVVAFALSATYTWYAWVTGVEDPSFTVTTPMAWVFYAIGFAAAVLCRREQRWARWLVTIYLGLLVLVAVFYYPTTFVERQQTTFGWFENDVYTALLVLALYLGIQRLRRVTLSSRV